MRVHRYARTDALERRPELGRLGRRSVGSCGCGCASGSRSSNAGIGDLPSTASYQAQIQAALAKQSAATQAQIAQVTGVDTTNATVSQGAKSAVSLLQGGYDPSNDSDNANLVHAIAGGLCLVPGIGPLLGGAVEGLWAVGNVAACPMEQAFSSIGFGSPSPACGGKVCTSSGTWTTGNVLAANKGALPSTPTGSFASLAVSALAMYAAQNLNCKGGMPASTVVDGVVNIWNQTHAGPAVPFYVPGLIVQPGSGAPESLLIAGVGVKVSCSGNCAAPAKAGTVPNVYYAFGPASAMSAYLQQDITKPPSGLFGWPYFAMLGTLGAPPGMTLTSPRTVMVNSGALLPQTPHVTLTLHLGTIPAHLSPATGAVKPASPAPTVQSPEVPVALGAAAAAVAVAAWHVPAAKSALLRVAGKLRAL